MHTGVINFSLRVQDLLHVVATVTTLQGGTHVYPPSLKKRQRGAIFVLKEEKNILFMCVHAAVVIGQQVVKPSRTVSLTWPFQ